VGDKCSSHVDHSCQLLTKVRHVSAASASLWVLPVVKDREAVPQEIGPTGGQRRAGLRGCQVNTLPHSLAVLRATVGLLRTLSPSVPDGQAF
jgi:hypothetical protein